MKKIEAIVRASRFEEVKEALAEKEAIERQMAEMEKSYEDRLKEAQAAQAEEAEKRAAEEAKRKASTPHLLNLNEDH